MNAGPRATAPPPRARGLLPAARPRRGRRGPHGLSPPDPRRSRHADAAGELSRDGVLGLPHAHREWAAEGLSGAQLDLLARNERELRQVAQQLVVAVRDAPDRRLIA